jgi:hypothetical protein
VRKRQFVTDIHMAGRGFTQNEGIEGIPQPLERAKGSRVGINTLDEKCEKQGRLGTVVA